MLRNNDSSHPVFAFQQNTYHSMLLPMSDNCGSNLTIELQRRSPGLLVKGDGT